MKIFTVVNSKEINFILIVGEKLRVLRGLKNLWLNKDMYHMHVVSRAFPPTHHTSPINYCSLIEVFYFGQCPHVHIHFNWITLISKRPLTLQHPSSTHHVLLNLECLISRNYKDLLRLIKIIRLNRDPLPRPPLCRLCPFLRGMNSQSYK